MSASTAPQTVDVAEELEDAFWEYSHSVVFHRALPDARDGLKPVQRRILYAMWEAGNTDKKPHRKSMSAVSDTMKLYHPHGDSAVYGALVRMAQPFVLNVPLVDGYGNFGGLDHSAAAPRYTEARLSEEGSFMLDGIKDGSVDFEDNFDASAKEPMVLPSPWPALLVNGSSGIAVGMKTEIPPHNITEAISAVRHRLKNPKCTLKAISAKMPAPDYPTGAVLLEEESDIDALYSKGKGSVVLRAKHSVAADGIRLLLNFTEIPYSTTPERIISRIHQAAASGGPLEHMIESADDLSDRRNGLLLQVALAKHVTAQEALEALYSSTPLQDTIHYAMNVLEGPKLVQCNLLGLLDCYIRHRREVTRRSAEFWLARTQKEVSDKNALISAYDRLDEVIGICRTAPRSQLTKRIRKAVPEASESQAEMIASLPLRRLGSLDLKELRKQKSALEKEKARLEKILSSDDALSAEVDRSLAAADRKIGQVDRRTEVSDGSDPHCQDSTEGPSAAYLLCDGRLSGKWEPKDSIGFAKPSPDGMLTAILQNGTAVRIRHDTLSASTDPMEFDTPPVGILREGCTALLVSSSGKGKYTDMSALLDSKAYQDGKPVVCMNLQDDETVLSAYESDLNAAVAALASDGMVLVMDPKTISTQGLRSSGVVMMSHIPDGRSIIAAGPAGSIYAAASHVSAKHGVAKASSLPEGSRATKGRLPKAKDWPDEPRYGTVSTLPMEWRPRKKAFCIKSRPL